MQVHTVAQSPMAITAKAQIWLYANYVVMLVPTISFISGKHCLQPPAYYTWLPSQYPGNLDQSTPACAQHAMQASTTTHSIIITTVVSVSSQSSVSNLRHHRFTLLLASAQNTKFTSSHAAYRYSSHSWTNNKRPANNPEYSESTYLHQGQTVEKCHIVQRWNAHGLLIYCVITDNVISYE